MRNTLPGYIRGGGAPSGDEGRFLTGSHPTIAGGHPGLQAVPPVKPEPRSEETDDGGGERTASGSFPVIDRRSAGLTRSFPPNAPTDQPATPSRLTRAFPGGSDPVAPQTTPLTGAFPGGDDNVPTVEPVDLPASRAAMAAPPAAPSDDVSGNRAGPPAGGQGETSGRPPLRLASRNDNPVNADGERPSADGARSRQPEPFGGDYPSGGFAQERPGADGGRSRQPEPFGGDYPSGGFAQDRPGADRAAGGAVPHPGFANRAGGRVSPDRAGGRDGSDGAGVRFGDRADGFAAESGPNGFSPDGANGRFATEGISEGFAPEGRDGGFEADGAFGRDRPSSPFGQDRPNGGFDAESAPSGFASDRPSGGFGAESAANGFASDRPSGGFGAESAGSGFASDRPGGGFGAEPAASGFAPERNTGGFAAQGTSGFAAGPGDGGESAGGFGGGGYGDEPPNRRGVDAPPGEPRSVVDDMLDELSGLPQRVPAEPDVPTVPEPPSDTPADPPQLARIATHLRRPDLVAEQERPDGFDVDAILAAVRGVAGVKDARLRTTPAGAHSLRLDLSDGADAADVSRHVARLLQERMGLAAAPQNLPGMMPAESPLGGDTPPTGFTRNGGYVPPPPMEPASRQTDAAAARSASRPVDAATGRPASRPADIDTARSGSRPADAAARSAQRPVDAAPGTPAQPPGFEPSPDPAQRPPASHRGRAQVGGQSAVDTRDLAERAAPVSAPPQGAPPHEVPPEGAVPQGTAPGAAAPDAAPAPRQAADDAERGHLYGGQREASRSRRVASDPPGQPVPGSFPDLGSAAGIIGSIGGHPVTAAATAYSGGQISTTESAPSRPLNPGANPGPRVVIDHVQVSTFGLDATVETRLAAGKRLANGLATGPAVDGYVLRLCAVSAAAAIDELLRTAPRDDDRGRCFVEHAAVVPFGNCEVAVVVVLLVCGGWVEQLAGSALVSGDPRQAVVRATLAAVNRRLEALLSD